LNPLGAACRETSSIVIDDLDRILTGAVLMATTHVLFDFFG
jgi:hypothetical protein